MYVDPFIFGVLCTLGAEILGLFIYALFLRGRNEK